MKSMEFIKRLQLLILIVLTDSFLTSARKGCDIRVWYLSIIADDVFNTELNDDQLYLKDSIEKLVMKHSEKRNSRMVDCSVLQLYNEMLKEDFNYKPSELLIGTDSNKQKSEKVDTIDASAEINKVDETDSAIALHNDEKTDPTEEIHEQDETDPTEEMHEPDETDSTEEIHELDETDSTEEMHEPDKTDPTEEIHEPDETDPTEEIHELDETDPTEEIHELDETDPTEEMHEPDKTDPTEKIHELDETDPTEEIHELDKTDPTEEIHQPNKTEPPEVTHEPCETYPTEKIHEIDETDRIVEIHELDKKDPTEEIHKPDETDPTKEIHELDDTDRIVEMHKVDATYPTSKLHKVDDIDPNIEIHEPDKKELTAEINKSDERDLPVEIHKLNDAFSTADTHTVDETHSTEEINNVDETGPTTEIHRSNEIDTTVEIEVNKKNVVTHLYQLNKFETLENLHESDAEDNIDRTPRDVLDGQDGPADDIDSANNEISDGPDSLNEKQVEIISTKYVDSLNLLVKTNHNIGVLETEIDETELSEDTGDIRMLDNLVFVDTTERKPNTFVATFLHCMCLINACSALDEFCKSDHATSKVSSGRDSTPTWHQHQLIDSTVLKIPDGRCVSKSYKEVMLVHLNQAQLFDRHTSLSYLQDMSSFTTGIGKDTLTSGNKDHHEGTSVGNTESTTNTSNAEDVIKGLNKHANDLDKLDTLNENSKTVNDERYREDAVGQNNKQITSVRKDETTVSANTEIFPSTRRQENTVNENTDDSVKVQGEQKGHFNNQFDHTDRSAHQQHPDNTFNRDSTPLRVAERLEHHHVEKIIEEKSKEHVHKIQNLEVMIMKLENQILLEALNKQNHSSTITKLENHILQLENELLRLANNYHNLREEAVNVRRQQNNYPELAYKEHAVTELTKTNAINHELLSQHQSKISQLSDRLRNQTDFISKIKEKYDYLENQNKILHQMVMNQSMFMSSIIQTVQELSLQNAKNREEIKQLKQIMNTHNAVDHKLERTNRAGTDMMTGNAIDRLDKYFFNGDSENIVDTMGIMNKNKGEILSEIDSQHDQYKSPETEIGSTHTKCHSAHDLSSKCVYQSIMLSTCVPLSRALWSPCKQSWNQEENVPFNSNGDSVTHVKHTNVFTHERKSDVQNSHQEFDVALDKYLVSPYAEESNPNLARNDNGHAVQVNVLDRMQSRDEFSIETESEQANSVLSGHVKTEVKEVVPLKNNEMADTFDDKYKIVGYDKDGMPILQIKDKNVVIDESKSETAGTSEIKNATNNMDLTSSQQSKTVVSDHLTEHVGNDLNHEITHLKHFQTKELKHNVDDENNISENVNNPDSENDQITKEKKDTANQKETDKTKLSNTPENELKELKEEKVNIDNGKGNNNGEKTYSVNENDKSKSVEDKNVVTDEKRVIPNEQPENISHSKEKERKVPENMNHGKLSEPKDCYDHYLRGNKNDGLYKVKLVGTENPVEVFCDMRKGGWTVIQRRQDGSTNFYQTWEEYKNGFGGLYGEHWLGNDNIYYLTNQDYYKLRVDLMDWQKTKKTALFEYFLVESEGEGYRLHIDGYSGDAGDGLTKHDGNKFSTKDVDNDQVKKEFGGSCAQRFYGAGWYYKCYASNLNGKFYKGGKIPEKRFDGITWKPWTGPSYSLKKVEMKIIPASAKVK